jgi:hypothetical protein
LKPKRIDTWPADARADDAADARGQLFIQRLACRQARVAYSLLGRGDAVMDEGVHGARILGADVGLQIEALDLACDLAGKVRCVELGDEVNAGLPGKDAGPGILHRVAHGRNATQAGHDDATTAHALNLLLIGCCAPPGRRPLIPFINQSSARRRSRQSNG